MKKSIFMKRKSNDNLSPSPKSLDDSKKKSADPNKKKSPGSASPRASEERKSPERKIPNPFSFTHAKKATNDIIQNEILKNEILKRKTEEMNLKNGSSLLDSRSSSKSVFSSSTSESSSGSSSEESDYEIQEVYQLKEWFPPDLASKPSSTDNNLTLVQSRTSAGLTLREMRIEADPSEFK